MKEHIKSNLMSFFIIVTLVNIVIFACGFILAPDEKLDYTAFIVPVIDGVLGVIPGLVMYSKRELTVKQMIFRNIIQLISIELIILVFSFGVSGFSNVDVPSLLAIIISVALVFIGVEIIMYLFDFKAAKRMTDDLKAFQKSNN